MSNCEAELCHNELGLWLGGEEEQMSGEVDEIMALQAEVTAAPFGQVRQRCDGSIAYRTRKPRVDPEAWIIVRPDGTTIGAGFVTVADMDPLLRWTVLNPT